MAFPWTDFSQWRGDGYAKSGVAVEDGDAALGHPVHAVPQGLDAASAAVSAPSSPDRAARVSQRRDRFVAGGGSDAPGRPRFGGLAGRE